MEDEVAEVLQKLISKEANNYEEELNKPTSKTESQTGKIPEKVVSICKYICINYMCVYTHVHGCVYLDSYIINTVQFSSVTQSCPTLFDPMNRNMPGLPVHHQLPEFTQTLIRRVGDAIQPFHPLSSPSPPAPNPSQHQSLFQ